MEINERIAAAIKARGVKKIEVAKRLNLSTSFLSQITKGNSCPSARTIKDLCREFGINEEWILTGHGDMFVARSVEQELGSLMADLLIDRGGFKTQFIRALAAIPPDEWPKIERFIDRLTAMRESENQELISSDKKE